MAEKESDPDKQQKLYGQMDKIDKLRGQAEQADIANKGNQAASNSPRGAITDEVQENRPGHVTGQIKIGDKTFDYGSGSDSDTDHPSAMYGSTPIGDLNYHNVPGKEGYEIPRMNNRYDPKVGREHDGVVIHRNRGSDLDNLYSRGCISIPKNQWDDFKEAVEDFKAKNGGKAYLNLGPDGKLQSVTAEPLYDEQGNPVGNNKVPDSVDPSAYGGDSGYDTSKSKPKSSEGSNRSQYSGTPNPGSATPKQGTVDPGRGHYDTPAPSGSPREVDDDKGDAGGNDDEDKGGGYKGVQPNDTEPTDVGKEVKDGVSEGLKDQGSGGGGNGAGAPDDGATLADIDGNDDIYLMHVNQTGYA